MALALDRTTLLMGRIRRRPSRWEQTAPERSSSVDGPLVRSPSHQSMKSGPGQANARWLHGDRDLKLSVRANRCVAGCLNGKGTAALGALLSIPSGRNALVDALESAGCIIRSLFKTSEEIGRMGSANVPDEFGESVRRLEQAREQWRVWILRGEGMPPRVEISRRPHTSGSEARRTPGREAAQGSHEPLPEHEPTWIGRVPCTGCRDVSTELPRTSNANRFSRCHITLLEATARDNSALSHHKQSCMDVAPSPSMCMTAVAHVSSAQCLASNSTFTVKQTTQRPYEHCSHGHIDQSALRMGVDGTPATALPRNKCQTKMRISTNLSEDHSCLPHLSSRTHDLAHQPTSVSSDSWGEHTPRASAALRCPLDAEYQLGKLPGVEQYETHLQGLVSLESPGLNAQKTRAVRSAEAQVHPHLRRPVETVEASSQTMPGTFIPAHDRRRRTSMRLSTTTEEPRTLIPSSVRTSITSAIIDDVGRISERWMDSGGGAGARQASALLTQDHLFSCTSPYLEGDNRAADTLALEAFDHELTSATLAPQVSASPTTATKQQRPSLSRCSPELSAPVVTLGAVDGTIGTPTPADKAEADVKSAPSSNPVQRASPATLATFVASNALRGGEQDMTYMSANVETDETNSHAAAEEAREAVQPFRRDSDVHLEPSLKGVVAILPQATRGGPIPTSGGECADPVQSLIGVTSKVSSTPPVEHKVSTAVAKATAHSAQASPPGRTEQRVPTKPANVSAVHTILCTALSANNALDDSPSEILSARLSVRAANKNKPSKGTAKNKNGVPDTQEQTLNGLQALICLLLARTAGDTESTIVQRVHAACRHMQKGPHADSCWVRLYSTSRSSDPLCFCATTEGGSLLKLRWSVGKEEANGLVGSVSGSAGTKCIHHPLSHALYKADVDGKLSTGQSLVLHSFFVDKESYVLSIATTPDVAHGDEQSGSRNELCAFIEAMSRHAQESLRSVVHVRAKMAALSVDSSVKRATRLRLSNIFVKHLRNRDVRFAKWFQAAGRASFALLPRAKEAEIAGAVQRKLMNASSVDDLTTNVMSTFQALIGAERSTLYLYDWKRNTLTSCFAAGANNFELKLVGSRLGIIGLAVVKNESILVEDCYSHPNFNPAVDRDSGFRTVSMLCLPLKYALSGDGDGEVIGAIQLINKLHPMTSERLSFTKADLSQCKAISMQIGLALVNIKHREQIETYSDMLAKSLIST